MGIIAQMPSALREGVGIGLNMKYMMLWVVLSSLCGAAFYALSWWMKAVQNRRKQQRVLVAATFALAALAAPFLALGGVELMNYQQPWTKGLPFLSILGSFLVGAVSPVLTVKLTDALIAKVETKVSPEEEK